jgi:hypothetical protein
MDELAKSDCRSFDSGRPLWQATFAQDDSF